MSPDELAAIRERAPLSTSKRAIADRRALLAHLDALTAAFADAFMRHPTGRMTDREVLAILRGEWTDPKG